MGTEMALLENDHIAVTNARFIVGSQTFARRGILSIQEIQNPPIYGGAAMIIELGLALALIGFEIFSLVTGAIGVLVLDLGIWIVSRKKFIFGEVLGTACGEIAAYRSHDWEHISRISKALYWSIIANA